MVSNGGSNSAAPDNSASQASSSLQGPGIGAGLAKGLDDAAGVCVCGSCWAGSERGGADVAVEGLRVGDDDAGVRRCCCAWATAHLHVCGASM
jgi:hypothetical protein